jgi:hypothetical protein
MRISGRIFRVGVLGVALLAALGGCGGGGAAMHDQQAGQSPASADPTPTPTPTPTPPTTTTGPAIAPFADMAHKASCSDFRNRLFIIDGKQVFWDRAGNCPDMSYQQVLYGATPQDVLCSRADSIAGPLAVCKDESARPLFDAIVQNIGSDDLGLGFSHTVERVSLLVPDGSAAAFQVIDSGKLSGIHAARTVVVKDAGAWATLWAEHAGAGKPLPAVDFSTSMVVGVFLGDRPNGCYSTSITGVTRNADGIAVQHTDTVPGMGVMCAMYVSVPAALAVVERSGLPVDFTTKIVPVR